jgi:hypothetical protein
VIPYKKIVAIGGILVTLGAAAGCPKDSPEPPAPSIEWEDCDAEDRRNREAECNLPPTTKKPTPAQTTKKVVPTSTPRATKRT